jgi:hypothetical protein
MRRLIWFIPVLSLAACGGDKPLTLSVTCAGGTQLNGAVSVDVLGDVVDGRPTLSYPDPVNRGKTGTIAVPARGSCRIVPVKPN